MPNLYSQVKQTERDAVHLRRQMETCKHEFTEPVTNTEVHTSRMDEASGGVQSFVLVQRRTCTLCGMPQHRTKFSPGRDYDDWKENP